MTVKYNQNGELTMDGISLKNDCTKLWYTYHCL
ncbi:Diaminopimelate decarboxylase [Staphylococcus aureus]|uniref:Diaminopimelate decarboxylase n=1 Tax=Staphylococcus aureus TaxID=1280 RepID=A0A8S1IBD4_STAAU|nr:Diaminopimelate decarboxylase [Staphylococcus aureus]SUJ47229.1 Diaminopimelate decarboxylase [Staphylococcus aureus]